MSSTYFEPKDSSSGRRL